MERTVDEHGWRDRGRALPPPRIPAKRPDAILPGREHRSGAVASSAENPTLFLESTKRVGDGFGLVAESDWLRLLFGMRAESNVAEIFSQTLALAPAQASISP